jgi:nucleoside-diphosphate-sugar epimerase
MVTFASTDKAKKDLGFEAKVSSKDGIDKINKYYSEFK